MAKEYNDLGVQCSFMTDCSTQESFDAWVLVNKYFNFVTVVVFYSNSTYILMVS